MVKCFFGKCVLVWIWCVTGASAFGELTAEGEEFFLRLKGSGAAKHFEAMEAWVFESNLGLEERMKRGGEVIEVICKLDSRSSHRLRMEGLKERLLKEHPGEWRVLLLAADIQESLPVNATRRDDEFVRVLEWEERTHDMERRDEIQKIRYIFEAEKLALQQFQNGGANGDDLARIYLRLVDLCWIIEEEGDEVFEEGRGLPEPDPGSRILPVDEDVEVMIDESGKLRLPKQRKSLDEVVGHEEREYWYLNEALRYATKEEAAVKWRMAAFWSGLLGVHRVADAGYVYIEGTESEFDMESKGEFELHTLKDDETFVVGPDGPKRVTLPEHCRYIPMLRALIDDKTVPEDVRWRAAEDLIDYIYPDRRKFDEAVQLAREMGTRMVVSNGVTKVYNMHFHDLDPGAELDGPRSFIHGANPEVRIYSRAVDEVEIEVWEVDMERVEEFISEGEVQDLVMEMRSLWIAGKGMKAEGGTLKDAWFDKICRPLKSWTVKIRRKPNLMQTATQVPIPVEKPGHYVVVRKEDGIRELLPIRIHDVAVVSGGFVEGQEGGTRADFFVVDPKKGEPIEGVEFRSFGAGNNKSSYFVSDHTGRLQGLPDSGRCLARRPGSKWQMIEWDSYRSSEAMWMENEIQSFLVTNQPLYRPGQKVSLAGWLKYAPEWQGKERVLPAGMPVRIRVIDPTGLEVWAGMTRLDEFGGFTGEFQLGDEVVLGEYRVRLDEGTEKRDPFSDEEFDWDDVSWNNFNIHQRWSFQVGEFRKPDFQVKMEASAEGDGFEAVIEASYLSGEPVKGARVAAELQAMPGFLRFFPEREWDDLYMWGYEMGLPLPRQYEDWMNWAMWPEYADFVFGDINGPGMYQNREAGSATGVTDENGRARLKFDTGFPLLNRCDYEVVVKAGVTEFTGRTVRVHKNLIHTGRPFEIFARPLRGFYREGEKVKVEIGMVDTGHEPKSGEGVFTLERMVDGEFVQVFERKLEVGSSGAESISFPAPGGGQYRCLFEAGGSKRGFILEVTGENQTIGKYGGVQIVPRDFLCGFDETVELMIRTDEPSTTVWLFEHHPDGHAKSPRIITTQNHTAIVRIPAQRSYQPNVIYEVLAFSKGEVKAGKCMVLFPDEESRLEVKMAMGQETGVPGGKAAVEIEVSDATGEVKEVSMALTVFDRALEDLSSPLPSTSRLRWMFESFDEAVTSLNDRWSGYDNYRELDEPGVFSGRMRLDGKVRRARDSRFVKIGGDLWSEYAPPELPNQVGGNIGGGFGEWSMSFPVTPATPLALPDLASRIQMDDEEGALVDGVGARSRFSDRAYWGGALKPGKDGRLRVDFDLPDNLTSWRVQSWAFGKGRSFGQARLELPVRKELQVRPLLPRAAVVGDELEIGAMIQNESEFDDTFIAVLEFDGGTVNDPAPREINLKSGDEGIARWRVKLDKAGGVLCLVKAVGRESKMGDGFETRMPVAEKKLQHTVSDLAVIRKKEKISEFRISFEEGMKGRTILVRGEADPAMSAFKVLPDLVTYPHGCVEQTLSRFLPLLIAKKAGDRLGLEWEKLEKITKDRGSSQGWIRGRQQAEILKKPLDLSSDKVDTLVHVGLSRLGELQNRDGSWGWFSSKDPNAKPYFTALAVRGLQMAGNLGARLVNNDPKASGVRWLESWSERPFPKNPSESWFAEAALTAWVLAEVQSQKAEELVGRIWEYREELSRTARIHLALATRNFKKSEILLNELRGEMNEVGLSSNGYYSWWKEPVEQRAFYLMLLVKMDAESEELEGEIRKLLAARTDGIRWKNTRECSFCIEAIIATLLDMNVDPFSDRSPVELEIKMMGKKHTLMISGENLWTAKLELPVGEGLENDGDLIGEITRRGNVDTEVFLNAVVAYPSTDPKAMQREDAGMTLTRRYYRVSEKNGRQLVREGEELKVGEVIEVELLIDSKVPRSFLHLRDPIPAGLEPMIQSSGYVDGTYRESRTGEAHFFITELSNWTRRHRYLASVVTEGVCQALPAQVECMYSPEVRGKTSLRQLIIGR